MKSFFIAFVFSLVSLNLSSVMATPTYLQALSDIPIADGLSLEDGSETIFDVPEGKIVEVTTFGPLDIEEVQKFYKESLEALGWIPLSGKPWSYKRSDETLEISFEDGDEDIQVKFRLTPTAASSTSSTSQKKCPQN